MSRFFSEFGIDWHLLIAQAINFGILFFALRYFLYKPLVGMLDKRRQEIEKSHDQTKVIEKKLAQIESTKEATLAQARAESEKIVKDATKSAELHGEKIVEAAKEEARKVAENANKSLALEKEKISQEIKKEIGSTLALAIEHSLGDVLDEHTEKKLLESTLVKLKK